VTFPHMLILFLLAVVGGTLNSVAGGGSFFTFPALIFVGIPAIAANASNTVALWPGSVASMGAYRHEIAQQKRSFLILMVSTSLIGGIIGAQLLLHTPASIFQGLIPYLLLLATLLFALSGPITTRLRMRNVGKVRLSPSTLIAVALAQLVIATYGGYFGGGIGILMLATLAMMGMEDIHVMNGLKTVLASCINGVAVVIFIFARAVVWPETILMIVGAIIGGYGGAYYARKVNPNLIRGFVIVVGFAMSAYFFINIYIFHHV
jgi:uncharacterized membrane protein YfcA